MPVAHPHQTLLQPSNVLLNSECQVKMADFGLARSVAQLASEEGNPVLTDYVATRWYRAPEILLSSHRYTFGVDMWACGACHAEGRGVAATRGCWLACGACRCPLPTTCTPRGPASVAAVAPVMSCLELTALQELLLLDTYAQHALPAVQLTAPTHLLRCAGCILGELINGKPIFPGTSTMNQLDRILEVTGRPSPQDIDSIQSPFAGGWEAGPCGAGAGGGA